MQTRCPACQTLYRIDEDVLKRAGGQARCFRCDTVFDAYANPADGSQPNDLAPPADAPDHTTEDELAGAYSGLNELPEAPEASGFEDASLDLSADDESSPPASRSANEADPLDLDLASDAKDADLGSGLPFEVPDDLPELQAAKETPPPLEDMDTDPQAPSRLPSALAGIAVLLLALLAIGQLAWFNREQVLATPIGHGMARVLCSMVDCQLPARRAPSRYAVLERNIGPAPDQSGVLAMHLRFRNDADFAQPLPDIQLSLYDTEERLMARRRLPPEEYLFPAPSPGLLVAPQEEIQVNLQLEDPGRRAVGFKLEFL